MGTFSFMTTVHSSVASIDSQGNVPRELCAAGGRFGEAAAQTQVPVKVILDVLGGELPTVHRRLVMPVDTLADVEDIRCGVGLVPAFSQRPPRGVYRQLVAADERISLPIYCPVSDAQFLYLTTLEL